MHALLSPVLDGSGQVNLPILCLMAGSVCASLVLSAPVVLIIFFCISHNALLQQLITASPVWARLAACYVRAPSHETFGIPARLKACGKVSSVTCLIDFGASDNLFQQSWWCSLVFYPAPDFQHYSCFADEP